MANQFFSSVQNGAKIGRIYGDNATLFVSWPVILINALGVAIYRGEDDWQHDDLEPSYYVHKVLSIPFQFVGAVIGAIAGAFAALFGKHLDEPRDESGYDLRPVVDF